MKNETKMFIGIRKGNGQFAYLSESLSIPEFFELIRPNESGNLILTDFSPVIETLHSLHKKIAKKSIHQKYNSIFNYWQDSKSYSNIQIRLPKFESLSIQSNELISEIQFMTDELKYQYKHRRIANPDENLSIIEEIDGLFNIYIDILLCFIHAKASLEIASFKKDSVLNQYCKYIYDTAQYLYNQAVEYSTYNDEFELKNSSLIYYIAFQNKGDLSLYTKILPNFHNRDIRIDLISKSEKSQHYWNNEKTNKIEICYREPDTHELTTAKILRNILYKAESISKLLDRLQQGDVQWDESGSSIEEVRGSIMLNTNKQHG